MKIILTKNYEELSKKAAEILAEVVKTKPNGVLGLATGSTPIGTYKELIEIYKKGEIDFSNINTVNLDEYRGIEKSNDQSYDYFMNDNLFSHVNIKKENTDLPDGSNPDADGECARYEAKIESLGGIDIQLLGIGHNGHIGFNEPADHFAPKTHCVKLDQITIDANARFFASAADVPKEAYTMGIGTIMSAKKVLLVATGEDKAEILLQTVKGTVTPAVQSSILQFHHDVTIVGDEKSLSKIMAEYPELISK